MQRGRHVDTPRKDMEISQEFNKIGLVGRSVMKKTNNFSITTTVHLFILCAKVGIIIINFSSMADGLHKTSI